MTKVYPRTERAGRAIAFALLVTGCTGEPFFRDPSAEPIKTALRTAIPLAYAASVAMASVNGSPPPNALVAGTCSSFPCTALVAISVDDRAVPLPFEPYGGGQILVAGLWTSPEAAILTVGFVDLFVGGSLLRVRDVSTFPAQVAATGLKIVYASIDVNVKTGPTYPGDLTPEQIDALFLRLSVTPSEDPAANVGLNAWVVDVDDGGTPDDFSDDTYTLTGGGEYVEASSGSGRILQLAMVGAVMAPGCAINPVEGLAVLNDTGASTSSVPVLATALIQFEPACTGKVKVLAATGNYLLATGKMVPL